MGKPRKPPAKDPHAVALGKRGGAKGGRTRAARLTPAERSNAAKLASLARWGSKAAETESVPTTVGEGGALDLRRLRDETYAAAQGLAQQSGTRLDDETAVLKLVEAVGQLAKAMSMKGSKANPPSRVKAIVAQELAAVLRSVMVLAGVMAIDVADLVRKPTT